MTQGQRKRRRKHEPALAPEQLDREDIVRIPMLAKGPRAREAQVCVARGRKTGETTHVRAQPTALERMSLDPIDDERRARAQLRIERWLVEPAARLSHLDAIRS